MNIIQYPKKFDFQKGISTEAIYYCGQQDWIDSLIVKLSDVKLKLTCLVGSRKLTEWDLKAVQNAEMALFNLSDNESELLYLALAGQLSQYPTTTIIYASDGTSIDDFLKLLRDGKRIKDVTQFEHEVRRFFLTIE